MGAHSGPGRAPARQALLIPVVTLRKGGEAPTHGPQPFASRRAHTYRKMMVPSAQPCTLRPPAAPGRAMRQPTPTPRCHSALPLPSHAGTTTMAQPSIGAEPPRPSPCCSPATTTLPTPRRAATCHFLASMSILPETRDHPRAHTHALGVSPPCTPCTASVDRLACPSPSMHSPAPSLEEPPGSARGHPLLPPV